MGRHGLLLLAGWLWSMVALGQVINPTCAQPGIVATVGCGGVVTLELDGDPVIYGTYAWNLGNGSTATGPGPITTTYTGAGPYTVSLTVTVTRPRYCQATTTISVTPSQGAGCCPSGIAANHLLGSASTPTTLSGGATYSGTYRVLGDLVLTNGTYRLSPGTIFYVDGQASLTPRQVTGATITLGVNASLVLDGATITVAGSTTDCPMWRGLVLDNRDANGLYQPPTSTRLQVLNHSTISHALCAIEVLDGYSNSARKGSHSYLIDQSTFANNLTHIRDVSFCPSGQVSFITNCTFNSDASQMHYPYKEDKANDNRYYTRQALYFSPFNDTAFGNAVEVRNNTINAAVYGIVNNDFDRAGVLIQGNRIAKVFQTGIWTANNDTNSGAPTPVTSGNQVDLSIYPPQNTDQIDPTATLYGIVSEQPVLWHNALVGNTITGDNNPVSTPKLQVGLSIAGQTDASGNTLFNLNEGIRTTELDGNEIVDNRLDGCLEGVVVQPSPNGVYQVNRLGCNTFVQSSSTVTSTGIAVRQDATINDIGSPSSPAANRFDGMTFGIVNDNPGTQVTYYRTNSSQESAAAATAGTGFTAVNTVTLPAGSLSRYCFDQGASAGNGVNQARSTTPSAGYLAALMDSVRRQLVPSARYRSYLYEIVSYHASTQQLPALETWWATLALPNAAAYRTVGRYLLGAYDAQRATAAAQRIVLGLQPQALLNAELAAQLQLRAVVRHLPKTTPRLVAADSVVLRTLAWSGTSAAESATRWLRYFHPRIPIPVPAALAPAAPRQAAAPKRGLPKSGVLLGAAYPNPAQTEVNITCQFAQAAQAAELRFTNLFTGQVALVVPVAGTGTERHQRVALAGLPAGQYAYQLVVEGQLAAAPQKLLVNP